MLPVATVIAMRYRHLGFDGLTPWPSRHRGTDCTEIHPSRPRRHIREQRQPLDPLAGAGWSES
jgi:hypothetical protein